MTTRRPGDVALVQRERRRLSRLLAHLERGHIGLAIRSQARELALQQLLLLQRVSQRGLHLSQPAELSAMLRSQGWMLCTQVWVSSGRLDSSHVSNHTRQHG